MPRIRVLSPVGVEASERVSVPPLPGDFGNLTVGFLDNTKPNFDRLVTELGRLLRERHGVKAVVHRRKANCSSPAPAELVVELAKACDVVFAGSAD
ncbi:MAG TPA: hypothetical protein VFR64_10700 [Methylomirabilota bacterium]|jgi:hypothetical protein|nr:hypothetical protein [Methylomirabilota bacterium]